MMHIDKFKAELDKLTDQKDEVDKLARENGSKRYELESENLKLQQRRAAIWAEIDALIKTAFEEEKTEAATSGKQV